jgi:hypothetical protein
LPFEFIVKLAREMKNWRCLEVFNKLVNVEADVEAGFVSKWGGH